MKTATLEQLRDGQLAGARQLKLACGLSEFPREIFDLADSLEVLDLSGNALTSLPDDLAKLRRLRILFASNNPFTELPPVLGDCESLSMVGFKANRIRRVSGRALPPQLRWLILTDNDVDALPAEIGERPNLQKLMLAGNRLRSLPETMAACNRLELLRISANRLDALPDWLLRLPRLAWLAYAGNPLNVVREQVALADAPVPDIGWHTLALGQTLGEGASGVTHRATRLLRDGHPVEAVAVKLFKGAVTSDGLPELEMAACLQAGPHPNLIPVLGKITGHPLGEHGLVMELIHPAFVNLAGPPSLDSCTRDVYAADVRFDRPVALQIARGIASAARHLHGRGIMHGDLYAHNILHDGSGHVLLGDFGAASFHDIDDRAQAQALERIEVRAFGCLLEELAQRLTGEAHDRAAGFDALIADCLREQVETRPSFDEIVERLAALSD
ncbi:leucine-rich repeat-containing protein kinase family protein [Paraburkholderia sp. CNPSo 3076]|uniref:leucine-rich repeat-containing protein kinase family protein n=1 Tax=Paraburkholderia sp. CNPSo 3076 TaxID=2940936 RepID=UPI002257E504|nr:leucine-rich repeat-containing protein kinase family protein [Paraburkholderia sp. CNPSo 3076]MCX5541245.1 leucine-rich repeat-containing protein kinase family protein [Paraburkholderia sp. CNPSo 3076]